MKPDLYTKAVLTVIAIMLTVIALKRLNSPTMTANAQSGSFASLQFDASSGYTFFDQRTVEVWKYGTPNLGRSEAGHLLAKMRLTKLGQPMTVEINNFK